MLVNKNQTRNWSAVSAVNVIDGKGEPVMYMTASFNGKDLNVAKNIQNHDLYLKHRVEVDADYAAFENEVNEDIGD